MKLAWCDVLAFIIGALIMMLQSQLQLYSPWKSFFVVWIVLRVLDGLMNGPNRRASENAKRVQATKPQDWWNP